MAESLCVGDAEAAAVGVILPRRHEPARVGHARQQSAASGVGVVGVANHRRGSTGGGRGSGGRRQSATHVGVAPGSPREIGDGRDMGPHIAVVGERQPAGRVAEIGNLRDPVGAGDVVDLHSVAKPVALRADRAGAGDERPKRHRAAVIILPREAGRGRTGERAEQAGRAHPSAHEAWVEDQPHPVSGEPGHRASSVGGDLDPVGIAERPALPQPAVRPGRRSAGQARYRMERVIPPAKVERTTEVRDLDVGLLVVDVPVGHVDGIARLLVEAPGQQCRLDGRRKHRKPRGGAAIREHGPRPHTSLDHEADGRAGRGDRERVADPLPLPVDGTAANDDLVLRHKGREGRAGVAGNALLHGRRDRRHDLRSHARQERGDAGHVAGIDLDKIREPARRGGGQLKRLHRRHALEVRQLLERQALKR